MSPDPITLTATTTSQLAVAFEGSTAAVCTVTKEGLLTTVSAGPCTVTAKQEGNDTYAAASAQRTFLITKRTQTITFANPGHASPVDGGTATLTMGHPAPTLTATSTSGLAVKFEAGPGSICTVTDGKLTLVAADPQCEIVATQEGNATFSPAPPVSYTIEVVSQFPGVDVVFGIGSLITANRTNYTINSNGTPNVLQGSQIGQASPQLLVGLSFQLPFRVFKANPSKSWADSRRPLHAFASLKFGTGSAPSLLGYTFGVTYRLQRYLDLLAGYTLTQFDEPSPGFRAAAVRVAASNRDLYKAYDPAALNNNTPGAFDGFPTQCITDSVQCGNASGKAAAGTALYNGNILEPHFRGGFMVGISVPVSLKALFKIP